MRGPQAQGVGRRPSIRIFSSRLAFVFTEDSTGWHQSAELHGLVGGTFGQAVAVSGDTIAVSGPSPDVSPVLVFTKVAEGWHRAGQLVGLDTVSDDGFGSSPAVSGSTIVVGAEQHEDLGKVYDAGEAYVFTETSTGWRQTSELQATDAGDGDFFGDSVSVSGNLIAVGAEGYGAGGGRAYVFVRTTAGWRESLELMGGVGEVAPLAFGVSVAVSDSYVVVGASGTASGIGREYVFNA